MFHVILPPPLFVNLPEFPSRYLGKWDSATLEASDHLKVCSVSSAQYQARFQHEALLLGFCGADRAVLMHKFQEGL